MGRDNQRVSGDERTEPGDSASSLAKRIAEHDTEAIDRSTQPLRLQWNVPLGRTPHIPLWLSLTFVGLVAVVLVLGLLSR
jgi:hypothetical protein